MSCFINERPELPMFTPRAVPDIASQLVNKKVYLDIGIGDAFRGRLLIQLYNDVTPLAAENFRTLCTGERGVGEGGKPLHYKGSKFHQIVPGFICVGGDIIAGDGSGGRESIYGTCLRDMDDTSNRRWHIGGGRGFLFFRAFGDGVIDSQFIICLGDGDFLDKHNFIMFGEIIEGEELLDYMELTMGDVFTVNGITFGRGTELKGKDAVITDCGELPDYPRVFFDVTVDNVLVGRIIMELYIDTNPLAAENFRLLCIGKKTKDGRPLHYKDSVVHQVIRGYGLMGGDIYESGGTSSFDRRFFSDDPLVRKHKGAGTLSMINCGEDDNPQFGSQFMISTRDGPLDWLDGKNMVFGHVVDGWSVVEKIEAFGHPSSKPYRIIKIADCGQIGIDVYPIVDCFPSSSSTRKHKRRRSF